LPASVVVDRTPDGTTEIPVHAGPAAQTPFFTRELVDRFKDVDRFNDAARSGEHHPVLLVGLFVLDLLTIHPFTDGAVTKRPRQPEDQAHDCRACLTGSI